MRLNSLENVAAVNRNDYASVAPPVTYATDLHAQNILTKFKPSRAYPIIRLPREYKALAGKKAQIYQREQEGELVFVVKVDKLVDKSCPPNGETEFESRLSALESRFNR